MAIGYHWPAETLANQLSDHRLNLRADGKELLHPFIELVLTLNRALG